MTKEDIIAALRESVGERQVELREPDTGELIDRGKFAAICEKWGTAICGKDMRFIEKAKGEQ